MADLVERDAAVAARLALRRIAVWVLRFRLVAEARRHEVLPCGAGHAGCLSVAVLHALLLRVVGTIAWAGGCEGQDSADDDQCTMSEPHRGLLLDLVGGYSMTRRRGRAVFAAR